MVSLYKTKLDIKSFPAKFSPIFVQFDHARLEIELVDEGNPYDLTKAVRVEFTHVRKDGLVIIEPGELVASNGTFLVCYEYKGSEMELTGKIKTSAAIFDAVGNKTSTHSFEVTIVEDLRNEVFNPAEPNAGVLQELLKEVQYVKDNPGPSEDLAQIEETIGDLRRRLLVLEGGPGVPDYEQIVYGDVIDIKDHFAIAISDDNILMLSEDYGETYTKSIDVSSLGMIKMVHPFTDGTVLFCTDARAYTTKDFVTFTESITLDVNGNPFLPTSLDNFSIQCKDSKNQIVDGLEMLVWGNYAHQGNNAGSETKLWYTVDKGKTLRLVYKFSYTQDNPAIFTLHVHGVIYHPEDKSFWILTGDHLTGAKHEAHFIKALYNEGADSWTLDVIGTGDNFKAGNMVFWEGYAYWSWDKTPGGVVRCLYEDIADVSKHELLLSTPNDCLDIVMSTHGEIIATQTIWNNTDPPRNFYYSADRINFHRIEGEMPEGVERMAMYNVIRINGANQVIGGVFNPYPGWLLTDWNLKPSAYLDKMVRNAGFKNAFLPPTIMGVPKIEAYPPGGDFFGTVSVRLTSNKPATIYYTTDGTKPTTSSQIYSEPITINSPQTLRFFGVDRRDGLFSSPATVNYTKGEIDLLAPILHYDFRGKTNARPNPTIIEDLSRSNVNGTLDNFSFNATNGYTAEGLLFDGIASSSVYAKISDELFDEGTMVAYFKPTDLGNGVREYYPSVLTNLFAAAGNANTRGYTVDLLQGMMYIEFAFPNGTGTDNAAINQGISLNQWNHLTITRQEGIFTIYYNGQQVFKSAANAPMMPNVQEFVVGKYNTTDNRYPYAGVVGYVKVFDYAITPEQALLEYQNREQLSQ